MLLFDTRRTAVRGQQGRRRFIYGADSGLEKLSAVPSPAFQTWSVCYEFLTGDLASTLHSNHRGEPRDACRFISDLMAKPAIRLPALAKAASRAHVGVQTISQTVRPSRQLDSMTCTRTVLMRVHGISRILNARRRLSSLPIPDGHRSLASPEIARGHVPRIARS